MNEQKLDAMRAFQLADDAWQMELERVYGKRAGDARYNSKLNGATAELEALRALRNEAMKAYEYQQIRQRVAEAAVYA